jgi:cell division protein FtsL
MINSPDHNKKHLDRRRFIGSGLKITLLAGLISPLEQACNTNTKNTDKKKTQDKSTTTQKTKRRKWTAEKLLINAKTNVVHLPTASFYVYYDEIKNATNVNAADWEKQVNGQIRFNKERSGTILEILSLQKLQNGVNDNSLNSAISTLALAFGKDCENAKGLNLNIKNYRLHELMLQLIVLNNYTPFKWKTFNDMVRKPEKLGKRQSWMADENSFNQRVKYIQERESEYKTRLSKRASKYILS